MSGSSFIPCSWASSLLMNCPSAPESTRANVSTVSFPFLSVIGTVSDDVFLLVITTGEIRISDGDSVGLLRLRQNPVLPVGPGLPLVHPPSFHSARLVSWWLVLLLGSQTLVRVGLLVLGVPFVWVLRALSVSGGCFGMGCWFLHSVLGILGGSPVVSDSGSLSVLGS